MVVSGEPVNTSKLGRAPCTEEGLQLKLSLRRSRTRFSKDRDVMMHARPSQSDQVVHNLVVVRDSSLKMARLHVLAVVIRSSTVGRCQLIWIRQSREKKKLWLSLIERSSGMAFQAHASKIELPCKDRES